jgi:DNA-binding SARP family transcriptional activator
MRGSIKLSPGAAHEVARVMELDMEKIPHTPEGNRRASCQLLRTQRPETVAPGDVLTVIRYAETVIDPDTGEVLAVAVEPVANLRVTELSAEGRFWGVYNLVDEKPGWVEIDDVVVKRTGNMLNERLWFHDPSDGFSEARIFGRSYLHAVRLYDSGQYREAILDLEDVVQIDPEYQDAAYLLGLCYANLNRYEEAAAHFGNLAELKPDDAKTWAALAYVYLNQGKLQKAAESYEKLAHLLPGDPEVWTDIGDIYRMMGDHQKAEQAYKKALEIDASDEEAAYELQVGK